MTFLPAQIGSASANLGGLRDNKRTRRGVRSDGVCAAIFCLFAIASWLQAAHADEAESTSSVSDQTQLHWQAVPGTKIRSVCPQDRADFDFAHHCQKVINAWGGAALDTRRLRFLVFGGGHAGYVGNEIYAVGLRAGEVERLTDPSRGFRLTERGKADDPCVDQLPDGRPTSRHSYNHLVYMPNVDRMWMFGGSRACRKGSFTNDTWTFDLQSKQWQAMRATGDIPPPRVLSAMYDPETERVLVVAGNALYSYSFSTNHYQRLAKYPKEIPGFYLMSATLNAEDRNVLIVGGGKESKPDVVYRISLDPASDYERTEIPTSGDTAILRAHAPGVAYIPGSGTYAAWDGAIKAGAAQDIEKIYFLDTRTWVWSARRFPGGPRRHEGDGPYGTYGRFRYVPELGSFAVVNHVDEPAFLLKMSPDVLPSFESH